MPNSTWSIYLLNEKGKRLEATKVKKYNELSSDELDFYPNITHWKSIYNITFPKKIPGSTDCFIKSDSKFITMELTGSPGKVILTWPLEGEKNE